MYSYTASSPYVFLVWFLINHLKSDRSVRKIFAGLRQQSFLVSGPLGTSSTRRRRSLTLQVLKFLQNAVYKYSPHLTGNTLRLRYKAQPVNAV
jgi:hypothetical protein